MPGWSNEIRQSDQPCFGDKKSWANTQQGRTNNKLQDDGSRCALTRGVSLKCHVRLRAVQDKLIKQHLNVRWTSKFSLRRQWLCCRVCLTQNYAQSSDRLRHALAFSILTRGMFVEKKIQKLGLDPMGTMQSKTTALVQQIHVQDEELFSR